MYFTRSFSFRWTRWCVPTCEMSVQTAHFGHGSMPARNPGGAMHTIDAFPHILPKQLLERMVSAAETRAAQTWLNGSRRQVGLYDLDMRFRVMDRFEDYRQVLTLATPPIEQVASGAAARDLARLANDSLAE